MRDEVTTDRLRSVLRSAALAALICGGVSPAASLADPPPVGRAAHATPLVTGRPIDPAPLASQDVGSIPVNLVLSPDGKFAVSTDTGFRQELHAIRIADGIGASQVPFGKSRAHPRNGLYYGLAFAPDGALYAAGGADDSVAVLKLDAGGNLNRQRTIRTRQGDFPAGLALDDRGRLYVADNDPADVPGRAYQTPGSIAIYDAAGGQELGRFAFTDSFGGTPNFPLALAVLRDGSRLYVASQRDAAVYVLNTSDPAHPTLAGKIPTGSHPISLLLDKSQRRLFVANALSDTVSVVDTSNNAISATILLRPEIARDVAGATPTGLALSPDEKRLYVTLGDMNAVAVVEVNDSRLLGYVPAGWYPTAVVVSPDNQRLLIANAKGTVARHPNPAAPGGRQESPISLIEGNVISVAIPSENDLPRDTQKVLELDRLTPRQMRAGNPLGRIGLTAGKIKHVIYVVKENRTYDQVLGDLPRGNGDANRCLFGRAVTPNQHALAERFVLLDNFYDCGEVSGDGWPWSTQAQANEYVIRNVPYSYSDRGRVFDYEGQVDHYPAGGFPAKGPDGKPLSQDPRYRNGAPRIPDVAEAPGGHIWDLVRKHGLSYRNYGFYFSDGEWEGKKVVIPDNYPSTAGCQPGGHDLAGISDVDFRRFDLDYPDSELRLKFANETHDPRFLTPRKSFGKHGAPSRFSEWNHEFKEMLAKAPDGSAVPNLMTVRFCTDHTMGTNPNHHSPRSMVCDNDYAVGQLVEAVSHSAIWKSTAIIVLEDDAQNGPDHVDAHRSTCFVISPYVKAHAIDHTFQNTVSAIRTIELLLGLPPMCQYDATAGPILDFTDSPDNAEPYSAIAPDKGILREINGEHNPRSPISPEQKAMMDESSRMDFAHADRAPADRLNEIIWKSIKGDASDPPPTPHGPPPTVPRKADRDDD